MLLFMRALHLQDTSGDGIGKGNYRHCFHQDTQVAPPLLPAYRRYGTNWNEAKFGALLTTC